MSNLSKQTIRSELTKIAKLAKKDAKKLSKKQNKKSVKQIIVQKPSVRVRNRNRNGVPGIVTTNNTSGVVCTGKQREKVCNVNGTAAFSNLVFSGTVPGLYINAGNTQLHQRGSVWASLYDKFRIKNMNFEFLTESYTGNATGASAGKVILVTNYDSLAPVFTSSKEAEEYCNSVRAVTYNNVVHQIRPSTRNTTGFDSDLNYYVNNSSNLAVPPTINSSLAHEYNPGLFQLITEGQAVTTEIGELWVTYDYEFLVPKAPTYTVPGPIVSKYSGTSSTSNTFLTTSLKSGSSSQLTVTFPTTNTIQVSTDPSLSGHIITIYLNQSAATTISAYTTVAATGNTTGSSIFASDSIAVINTLGTATTPQQSTNMSSTTSTTGIWNLTYVTSTVVGACTFDLIITVLPQPLVTGTESREEALEKRIKMMEEKFQKLSVMTDFDDDEYMVSEEMPRPPCSAASSGSQRRN